jgi:hypothetical protein
MEPRYVATVKIEKVTPKRGTVGFSVEEPQPETREEVMSVKVTDPNLLKVVAKLNDHLEIVEE